MDWQFEAARELADIQSMVLQGYFESKEALCDRLTQSTEALRLIGESEQPNHFYSEIALTLACSILSHMTEKNQQQWAESLTAQAIEMFHQMPPQEFEAFCQANFTSPHAAQRQERN